MKYTQRPYQNDTEKHLMVELSYHTADDNLHVVDLPYRLSSWALDEPSNTRLWFDEHECLISWAVMQTPFWSIDYVYHPEFGAALHREILAWADLQAQNLTGTPYGRPARFINVFDNQIDRIHDLEAVGFAAQADVGEDSWRKVLMQRTVEIPIGESNLPEGFRIRPLKGGTEVDRYVDAHQITFESKSMTISWRMRILDQQDYIPSLDLTIEAPDGRMAGFCI
jgi:hypothetical protein